MFVHTFGENERETTFQKAIHGVFKLAARAW